MAYIHGNGFDDKNLYLVLGIDIPEWVCNFEKNKCRYKNLNKEESVLTGYIMWELIKSGTFELKDFDGPNENKEDLISERSFGKIMSELHRSSGCVSTEDYERTFDKIYLKDRSAEDKYSKMGATCLATIGAAVTHSKKIKLIEPKMAPNLDS